MTGAVDDEEDGVDGEEDEEGGETRKTRKEGPSGPYLLVTLTCPRLLAPKLPSQRRSRHSKSRSSTLNSPSTLCSRRQVPTSMKEERWDCS